MIFSYLDSKQVIRIHDQILLETGGFGGIRDLGLLESALDAPKVAMFGKEMYASIGEKGAVLLYHLIKNHAFNDGNKRTAFTSWVTFYEINRVVPTKIQRILVETLCPSIADGLFCKDELLQLLKDVK